MQDAITAKIIRDVSRRYMSFGAADATVSMPPPNAAKRYLLYLHIPFCVVLCPFCSFHRVQFQEDRARSYFAALRAEIQQVTDAGFRFGEVYIGGGTPTVMPDELIATVNLIRALHPVERISVETNPDDLDDERLPQLHDVGVNRLSVGVQSFDDRLLREMQRYEKYGSGEQIKQRLLRVEGEFETLNVDMIFNFPHQSETSLATDLHVLTAEVNADQVSFYPLMTSGSTARSMRKEMGEVDYGREKKLYQLIVRHMLEAGYRRSSAWCFSRDAGMIDEYITQQDEYLGLGSGAFSFLGGSIYASTFSINHYLALIAAGRTGIVRQRAVGRVDHMRYFMVMRLFSGCLELATAETLFEGHFQESLRAELLGLRLIGAITIDATHIRLTERGYYVWVVIMREFFTGVNSLREEMRLNIHSESELLVPDQKT